MITMVSLIRICLFLVLGVLFVNAETGCPEAGDIVPCTCTKRPTVRLTCTGFQNPEQLDTVFTNSERYTYQEVHIENSSFSYIPSNIFQKVIIKELYLRNVTLVGMFYERETENHDLYKLQLENVLISRSISSANLSLFSNLKELSVYNSSISTLSRLFGKSMPENIKKIILYGTNTKSISNGSLDHLPNLDKLAVEYGNLRKLSRDSFPRPFYARILSFNGNKITTIPEDLFTDMPNLQFLSMMNNAISVIPETAFSGRILNVPYFRFEGNSLQCDCQLLWLINDKPEVLGGTCSSPEHFTGRKLQDLIPAEISC